jgi:hypothetical protein
VADRVRVAHARKRRGAKRPAKRQRTRGLRIFGLSLLAALILGFLAKRVMIPSVVHYIAYRPPDQPQANTPASEAQGADNDSENLTPGDRRQLDEIIKRKTK